MQALWGWLTGPPPNPKAKEAQACFSDEELKDIRSKFTQAVQLQGNGLTVLQEHAFLKHMCALPVRKLHHLDTADPGLLGVSLDDLLVAKAACERMGTSDSHTFAYQVLCELARLTSQHSVASHAHAPSSPRTATNPQQPISSAHDQHGHFSDTGISLDALERCLTASCALLEACGALLTPSPPVPAPPAVVQPPVAAKPAPDAQHAPFLPFPHAASIPRHVQPPAPHITSHDTVAAEPSPASEALEASTALAKQHAKLQCWVSAAARGALLTAAGPVAAAPAAALDLSGYAKWVKSMPAWHGVFSKLLSGVGAPQASTGAAPGGASQSPTAPTVPATQALSLPRTPHLTPPGVAAAPERLLHPLAALLLSSCMAPAHQQEWQLLFHSDRDGKSFNTLLAKLTAAEGPTLLLVKESGPEGHLVAGYAPVAWVKSGTFIGDHTTWVARLAPDMQVFTATGANTNFMWCGQGFKQLTNGVGFGGAQGPHTAFALLVDSTLDQGQSRPIATFGSPSLTQSQVFQVEAVEAWLLQQPEEDPYTSKAGSNKKSVLEKVDKADKLILELGGRQVNNRAMIGLDEPLEEQ